MSESELVQQKHGLVSIDASEVDADKIMQAFYENDIEFAWKEHGKTILVHRNEESHAITLINKNKK